MGEMLFLILRWFAVVLTVGGALYWLMVNVRIRRALRSEPMVTAGLETPEPEGGWPLVSVVIPAHNESRVIAACAKRLLAQTHPRLEIMFVLDRCTDNTRELLEAVVANDDRVRVIENDACPTDWAGKCHAAHLGAQEASGEYLLFTDADTEFDPELIRAAVGLAIARDIDLLSLLSTLTDRHWFERTVQPVAGTTLMAMYPIDRVNKHEGGRSFANGQFMLFRGAMYRGLGGHECVKDDLLEDIAFARKVRRAGGRQGIFMSNGLLRCSMYETFDGFLRGWRRIYIEACKRKPARLRKAAIRIWVVGILFPIAQIAAIAFAIHAWLTGGYVYMTMAASTLLLGWLFQTLAVRTTYRLAGAPRWAAFFHFVGSAVVGRTLWMGASDLERRRPVKWGGREYVLEPRR